MAAKKKDKTEKTSDFQTIKHKGKVIAHIFRNGLFTEGVRFLTPHEYTLQLGVIEHPKRHQIENHGHNPDIKYKVDTTQEFLYIEKGKVLMKLFSDDFKLVKKVILKKGDFTLFVSGAHGFEVLQKCRMIEVKQGPYPGDKIAKIYKKDEKK